MKDLNGVVIGNAISPTEWNHERDEVQGTVESTGQTLNEADATQQRKAIATYSGAGDYYTMGGTVTAIVLTIVASLEAPHAYRDGLRVRFRPTGQATGAATIRVGALAIVDLKRADGAAIQPGDFDTLADVTARYSTAAGDFLLDSPIQTNANPANLLDNGDFCVQQHVGDRSDIDRDVTSACETPGGGNDNYDVPIDRWHIVSDGNDVVNVRRLSHAQNLGVDVLGTAFARSAIRLTVTAAGAAKKFGLLQNIEAAVSQGIIDEQYADWSALSFYACQNAANHLSQVRMAIIGWSGTINELTATPISAWNASGASPSLAASNTAGPGFTVSHTPPASDGVTWTRFSIPDGVVPAGTKNIRVMIWVNAPAASVAGDWLQLTWCKVERGRNVTPYAEKPYVQELAACRRHYQHLGYQEMDASADANKCAIGGGQNIGGSSDFVFLAHLSSPFSMPLSDAVVAFSPVADFKVEEYGGGSANTQSVDTIAVETNHRSGRDALALAVDTAAANAEDNYSQLTVGGAADGDGFFDAGIHIRSKL